MKICRACGASKSADDFYKGAVCKVCYNSKRLAKYHADRAADPQKFREAERESRARRKETINAWKADYRARNLERVRSYGREWYRRHRGELRAKFEALPKEQQDAIRQKTIERLRRGHAEHRDERLATNRIWRQNNRSVVASIINRYKARKRGALISEKVDRTAIIERDRGICYLCGAAVLDGEISLDHVVPLFRGGSHTGANLRLAHWSCNRRKSAKLLSELDWYKPPADGLPLSF